ncbi:class I SAM-dependent methyltransferase [Xanthocytophaga agilis]|uniref:Class I SAM-dependent methyltransferase n=1 Tax=Xanthocytophaga agilis TaxID=3048010 RepID=A0AAE3R4D5_9BACT|nr:class I SAM-dependent methyltransferase [Xanthocytophaga agilis]MDJ1503681.1 class I SAM-dependent methyltransferase [Xanthocytophaga agilis]
MTNEFVYTGDDVLDVMSKFAVKRNKAVESLITTSFNLDKLTSQVKLLEFGAGRGEFINRFRNKQYIQTLATDLDEDYCLKLSQNHTAFHTLDELPYPVNFIFAIDVLEHIEDDLAILKQMHQSLTSGGKIFIYVPARQELYSQFDKQIGHFRRYHLKDLKNKALQAGFTIDSLRYHDFLGYFAAYYNKFFFKENDTLNSKAVSIYDTYLVPVSNVIEKLLVKPFIGKDLLLVASK